MFSNFDITIPLYSYSQLSDLHTYNIKYNCINIDRPITDWNSLMHFGQNLLTNYPNKIRNEQTQKVAVKSSFPWSLLLYY